MLTEVISVLGGMRVDERAELAREVKAGTHAMVFTPNPGPQTQAYLSEADVLLYGGQPFSGKTALEVGLAINEHRRALIVRKNFNDLRGLIDTAKELAGRDNQSGFIGGSRPEYRKPDGGVIHFMGMPEGGGIGGLQGEGHDLICLDECAQLNEAQVRLIMGWLRTTTPGQRVRAIFGSNPPLDDTGDWMIDYFAPWLDQQHPNPAKPGELRYFLEGQGPNGSDLECEADAFYIDHQGTRVGPRSRTYIPASYRDNPYANAEDYAKVLAGLPDYARDRLRTGDFMLARTDKPGQVIPTEWVKLAQARWKPEQPRIPMSAMAVDCSGGGRDPLVISRRHDGWYAPLERVEGANIPSDNIGPFSAGIVVTFRRDDAVVIIDMGGGYGGSIHDHLKGNGVVVKKYLGAEGTVKRSLEGKMAFTNTRSAAYWLFREALDPAQEGGSPIALPPGAMILSDLTAPTFKFTPNGIQVEPKDKVCDRLQRSTDEGDSIVMCWFYGPTDSLVQSSSLWRPDQRVSGSHQRSGSLRINNGPRRPR